MTRIEQANKRYQDALQRASNARKGDKIKASTLLQVATTELLKAELNAAKRGKNRRVA